MRSSLDSLIVIHRDVFPNTFNKVFYKDEPRTKMSSFEQYNLREILFELEALLKDLAREMRLPLFDSQTFSMEDLRKWLSHYDPELSKTQ